MTTPGGVPNLPAGALTLGTMATKLQDMSGTAMKSRAVERFPTIMDASTGLSPASDITPFGILTGIFAGFNSVVANADPADVGGPEDLPTLLLEFIEGLPVIGQFVGLFEAILGTYDGDDEVLLALQTFFVPIRALLVAVPAIVQQVIDAIVNGITGSTGTGNDPSAILWALITAPIAIPGQLLNQILGQLAALQAQMTAVQNNPGAATQTDDFASVGLTAWTSVLNTLSITNGHIQTPTISAGYIGTTGTPRKPLTDKHGAQIIVDAKMRGAVRLLIASDATASNYACLEVYTGFDGDAMRIMTGSSPSLAVVQKQVDVVSSTLSDLTAFDFRYDPASNKLIALRNGQPVGLEWPDITNIVGHGSGKRHIWVVSNAHNGTSLGSYGFGVKKVTYYDW